MAGPWEKYQQQPSQQGPWTKYAPQQAREPSIGSVAGQTALGLGVDLPVSTVGLFGDVMEMKRNASDWMAGKMGVTPEQMQELRRLNPLQFLDSAPTSKHVMGAVESVTGPIPEPQNTPEKIGRFVGPFLSMVRGGKPNLKNAPSVDDLRRLKDTAYEAADTGIGKVRMTRDHVGQLQRGVNQVAAASGHGGPLSDTVKALYSQSLRTVDDLNRLGRGVRGGTTPPPTFGELEKMRQVLRKVANQADAKGNLTPDAHMAQQFIGKIDDLMDATPFQKARKAHQTLRKAEMIEDALFRAEMGAGANFTQAGLETALRQQFRQMAVQLNKQNWRGWTTAEKDAILKVVKGGPMQNLTRLAGAMAPRGGLSQAFYAMLGLNAPYAAVPLAVGTSLARHGAQTKTVANAQRADALVRSGGGPQTRPTRRAIDYAPNALLPANTALEPYR